MPRLNPQMLRELFNRAREEPLGLCIELTNPTRFVQHLASQVSKDYPELMICTPSLENTVFIVQKSVELDP